MGSNIAPNSVHFAGGPSLEDETSLDGLTGAVTPRLTRRAAVIVALLLSLGLWATIAALALAVLG